MSVLLTRPEADSREIADLLSGHGIDTVIWPLTRIVPVADVAEPPPGTDGLIFTSANAVAAFAAECRDRTLPVLAVGDRTAAVARAAGFARTESAGGDAHALIQLAARSGLTRLFHPRGRDIAADLAGSLAADGIALIEAVVYSAERGGPPPSAVDRALAAGQIDAVTLWSARNALLFKTLWQDRALEPLHQITAITISERAAAALDGWAFGTILTAERPDRTAMIEAILRNDAALRR